MADPVKTPSETPNQPAVETPPAVAATTVAQPKVADPAPKPAQTSETPPAAKAATPPATDDKPATPQADLDAAGKALADAAAAKAAADAAAAAPPPEIKYEIKPPEGMQIDPELIPALAPALKKAGLTNEQLQTVADSFLEFQKGLPQRMLAKDLEVTAKDAALGGMRYGQTLKEVNIALDAFGDPEFKKFVQTAGIANRLEFVRVFQRIGEAMAKAGDTPARGEPDGAPELTRAQRMYGGKSKSTN